MTHRVIRALKWLGAVGGWLMVMSPFLVLAQSGLDETIDAVRRQAIQQAGPDRLGAGYAAMMNFAATPDISSATYYIDGG